MLKAILFLFAFLTILKITFAWTCFCTTGVCQSGLEDYVSPTYTCGQNKGYTYVKSGSIAYWYNIPKSKVSAFKTCCDKSSNPDVKGCCY